MVLVAIVLLRLLGWLKPILIPCLHGISPAMATYVTWESRAVSCILCMPQHEENAMAYKRVTAEDPLIKENKYAPDKPEGTAF